jgi:predicted GNAT superfamily acetyltransferase
VVTEPFTIRPFASIEEFVDCVDLQEATWGVGFSERVPPAILKIAQMLGGIASGAYDADGGLVGFVFGLTGLRGGEIAHWSDMLAVRPGIRDAGLGRRMKEYQREIVLGHGVEKMFWTFDPLQSRNAHLNITRLGAVVREYVENMYGNTDSPLHKGIGTDRFVALWLLASERVESRLSDAGQTAEVSPGATDDSGGRHSDAPWALSVDASGPWPRPVPVDGLPGTDAVRVSIPSNVTALMHGDLGLAVEWRLATRAVFGHYLSQGYEVCDFERGEAASTYLVARIDDLE